MPAWATADEALPALIARLKDHDESVVGQAAKALGRYKDARAAGPLLDVFRRHHFEVEHALKEIGAAAEPALLERIDDSDASVRRQVIGLLGEIGTEKSEPVLTKLSNSDDGSIKFAAEQALQKIRQRSG